LRRIRVFKPRTCTTRRIRPLRVGGKCFNWLTPRPTTAACYLDLRTLYPFISLATRSPSASYIRVKIYLYTIDINFVVRTQAPFLIELSSLFKAVATASSTTTTTTTVCRNIYIYLYKNIYIYITDPHPPRSHTRKGLLINIEPLSFVCVLFKIFLFFVGSRLILFNNHYRAGARISRTKIDIARFGFSLLM